jgi:hypothetical protein
MTVHWYTVFQEGSLLLDDFIMESTNSCGYSLSIKQIMSYVFNFVVEILLLLTHDLGLTDPTMNDSPFHVIWVVGLEGLWAQLSTFRLKMETESSFQNAVF